jgi:hypothetical protein
VARRVVVHVGLPKTGTTYVQSVLWQNRRLLAEQGVLYPGRSRRQHMWASMVVREHPGVPNRGPQAATSWDDLLAEIEAWEGTAVVSHEFFGAATEDQAARALERLGDTEVHVLTTARDVLTVNTSYWQEYVKHGFVNAALDDFPVPTDPWDEWGWPALDLEGVLRRWGSHLTGDRVHVLVLPGPGAPRSALLDSYAAIVGFDPTGMDTEHARANASLGVVQAELLRRVAPRLEGFTTALDRGVWIRSYLSQDILVPQGGERFLPSPARVAELRERAASTVAHIREAGLSVHGDIDRLLVPDDLVPARHPDSVTEAEMLDAATATIAAVMEDVRRFRRENTAYARAAAAEARRIAELPPPLPTRVRRKLGRLADRARRSSESDALR